MRGIAYICLFLSRNKSRGMKKDKPTRRKKRRVRISNKIWKVKTGWMSNKWPGIAEKSETQCLGVG